MVDVPDHPNPIDLYVGSRLRLQRILSRLSQSQLAEAIGVSFQQIQKYERGTNRLSASRLYKAAQFLNVPVSFFFQGYDDPSATPSNENERTNNVIRFINSPDGVAFANVLCAIHDNEVRKQLLELARTLANRFNAPTV